VGLPEVVALIMVLALNAYALTGGADFGGGVWDLLARGPGREAQRTLIAEQIAPIWEANHVWLILVVVMLFTAFPAAFAALGIVLHIPLTLMLLGIVARGSSFVFRSYGAHDDASQRRWGRVFAVASVITPLLSRNDRRGDRLRRRRRRGGTRADHARRGGSCVRVRLRRSWLAPFPLALGVLALAMFAFLAAVYLGVREPALRDAFQRRALWAAGRDVRRGIRRARRRVDDDAARRARPHARQRPRAAVRHRRFGARSRSGHCTSDAGSSRASPPRRRCR
jgi:cytochrome d ubiquinol oxidase subunit II